MREAPFFHAVTKPPVADARQAAELPTALRRDGRAEVDERVFSRDARTLPAGSSDSLRGARPQWLRQDGVGRKHRWWTSTRAC